MGTSCVWRCRFPAGRKESREGKERKDRRVPAFTSISYTAERAGEYSMPWWVFVEWLKEHGCARRDLGEVSIPFVWMPSAGHLPEFDFATYREVDGEPGRYELEWFS